MKCWNCSRKGCRVEVTDALLDELLLDNPPVEMEIIVKDKVFPASVIVDTREQAAFHFLNIAPWSIVPLQHMALMTGDYSLSGFEDQMTIERKSISDFLGSIIGGRDRFEREFERMSEMRFAAVVVEGELSTVLEHSRSKTRINTDSILGTLDSWRIRYGVHWVFCMGRRHAEIQTLKLLYQFWRIDREIKKSAATAIAAKSKPLSLIA